MTQFGQFLHSRFLQAFGVTFGPYSFFPRVLDQIPTSRDTLWAFALKSEALLINFSGELDMLNTTTPMSAIPDIGTLPVTCAEVS